VSTNLLVEVRNGDLAAAQKVFKRKSESGVKRDILRSTHYGKPGERRRLKSLRARRREARHARKVALTPTSRHDLRDMASGGYY
jgi:ribosomal protein S21